MIAHLTQIPTFPPYPINPVNSSDTTKATVSIIGAIISLGSLIANYFYPGKMRFSRPSIIGAHLYGNTDVVLLPITIANTGTITRAVEFKMVVNHTKVFHHNVDSPSILLPLPDAQFTPSFIAPSPVTLKGRDVCVRFTGFTQHNYLRTTQENDLICDVWMSYGARWRFAFRITWDQFGRLRNNYGPGLVYSSNFHFTTKLRDFDYSPNILDE